MTIGVGRLFNQCARRLARALSRSASASTRFWDAFSSGRARPTLPAALAAPWRGRGSLSANRDLPLYRWTPVAWQAILAPLATAVFVVAATGATVMALTMRRGYQDLWILQDLATPFLLLLGAYLVATMWHRDLAVVAALAGTLTVLMYALPALKYARIYSSSIDATVHLAMVRSLTHAGLPVANYYQHTPGMHLLVASMAQLSGLSHEVWLRLVPALMGGLIPLGTYVLLRQAEASPELVRLALIISPLSAPLVYLPNGTAYAVLIVGPLLLAMLSGKLARQRAARTAGAVVVWLLFGALIIWHSITSLYVPIILAGAGIGLRAFATVALRIGRTSMGQERVARAFLITGLVGAPLVLFYWASVADSLWLQLTEQSTLLVGSIWGASPSEKALVPQPTATLGLAELIAVFAFYHGRDAVLMALGALGSLCALWHISWHSSQPQNEIVLGYAALCAMVFVSGIAMFASGYSVFEYERLLTYAVIFTYIPAGYALWTLTGAVEAGEPHLRQKLAQVSMLLLVFLLAAMQLYPYQPAIPAATDIAGGSDTPLHWVHRVNSDYQYRAIMFASERLPSAAERYTNYTGHQQAALFLGLDARDRFRSGPWERPSTAYVLLHVPGRAGAYAEQAAFRSAEAIAELRHHPSAHMIYDNGGSFILLVPADEMWHYSLQGEP